MWPEQIDVEAKDGFERIELQKWKCSCFSFARLGSCEHLESTSKWLGKHWNRYLALSAFQKEIRRSDTERVFAWAKIILAHQGEYSLLRHLERLVFEETRAITLWLKLRKNELSLYQALEWVSTAAKKQELTFLNNHFDQWADGFKRSFARPCPLPLEFGQMIRSAQDASDIATLFFDLRRDPQLQPYFWSHLGEIASQTKNEKLLVFLRHNPSTSYERFVAMELLIGLYDSQAKHRHTSNRTHRTFIPLSQRYYEDVHTARGKAIWINNFGEAWKTKNFDFGDFCANWSGSLFGVLFRERCFEQKSSMKKPDGSDWSWTDVVITAEDYQKALAMERHYYKSVMAKIEDRYPNLLPTPD